MFDKFKKIFYFCFVIVLITVSSSCSCDSNRNEHTSSEDDNGGYNVQPASEENSGDGGSEDEGITRPGEYVDGAIAFYSSSPFTLRVKNSKKNWNGSIYYCTSNSKNDEDWVEWYGSDTINADKNNSNPESEKYYIFLRGKKNQAIGIPNPDYSFVLDSQNEVNDIVIDGNMANLLNYNIDYSNNPELKEEAGIYVFSSLFRDNVSIKALGDNFSLSSIVLSQYGYDFMFKNCTSLSSLGSNFCLPATELQAYNYYSMFEGCTSLESLPETFTLNAKVIGEESYGRMFYGCKNLVFEKDKENDENYRVF